MTKRQLPEGWRMVRLRDVLSTLESGLRPKGGVRGVLKGVASIGAEHLNDEGGFDLSNLRYIPQDFYTRMQRGRIQAGDILVVKDGATTGKVSFVPSDWPFDKSAANEHVFVLRPNREALAEYLFFYLYSPVGQHDIKKSFHGSAQGGINQSFAAHVPVPLPPLPVQERIVQILQKADEIRRKAKDALDTVDSALVSLFLHLLGDPAVNPKGWPTVALGEIIADWQNGFATGQKEVPAGIPQVRMQNITTRGWFDATLVRTVQQHRNHDRYVLQHGDVLFNNTNSPELVGKTTIFRESGTWYLSNHISRIRPAGVTSEYLWGLLLMLWIRGRFRSMCRQWVNQASVSRDELLKVKVPLPDERALVLHKELVNRLEAVRKHLVAKSAQADALFRGLLTRAFTGELTADWEAVNAEAIRQRQAFEEQVPRLVALDLLAEKAASTAPAAPEAGLLLTAMMKLLFLVQMKGSARRRFYHFVPYHYGPFAKELYDDLERLQQEGLVSIEQADEDKTRLMLADADRARQMVAQLPEDLRQDVRTVLDEYGGLTHNQLLARVYEEFPAYARRSRLRHAAAKKAGTGRSAT